MTAIGAISDDAKAGPTRAAKAVTLLLLIAAAVSLAAGARNALMLWGSIDLGMSLEAAQVLQRENPYERHFAGRDELSRDPRPDVSPFVMLPAQVPSALMLLWPYSLLSWPMAKLVWLISNLFFTAGLLVLAFRRFLPGRSLWLYAFISGLLLVGLPWRVIVGNGQHLLAGLFFYLLAMDLADRGKKIGAGLALAASFVKYSCTIFLLPWFILKRQWQPPLIAFAIHSAMTLGIALWLGENPVKLVVQSIKAASDESQIAGYLDLFALTYGLGAPMFVPALASAALFLTSIWLAVKNRAADQDLYFAMLCMVSTILIYHRAYDQIILLVPLLVAIRRWPADKLFPALVATSLFFIWFVDKPVRDFTDWLSVRTNPYYYLLVLLFYSTLVLLLYRQLRPSSRDDADLA